MPRRLLLSLALVVATAIPLSPSARADSAAGAASAAAGQVGRPATGGQPQLQLIQQSVQLLEAKYFEPIDSAALYTAAVEGATEELARQKVNVALRRPSFGRDSAANWEQFSGAYMGAASGYAGAIDQQALAYATISAIAESVKDCHTYFVPASAAQQMRQGMRGAHAAQGTGIVLRPVGGDYPLVESVFKDSPAEKSGIKRGDRLLSIDGQDVKGLKPEQMASKLREPAGTAASLVFSRASFPAPLPISVVRGSYQVPVYETSILPGNVGYVRIFTFAESIDTAAVQQMYREVANRGATSVLIDLRNNPGGSGQGAIALMSALIGPNRLLFSHYNRDGSTLPMNSVENLWPKTLPAAVLINERTASAGEIVAAVVQDYGVARVFGQTSKGCLASVEVSPLSDGSALGVTSARVVTAKGRSLNRVGVSPDVRVELTVNDLMRGEDPQLQRAAEFLRTGK